MPKVTGTRKQLAQRLLKRIVEGPSFSNPAQFGGDAFSVEEATRQYQNWAASWVVEDVKRLVPELKKIWQKGGA